MENKPNLYVWGSANDRSFPVLPEELCLLKEGAVEDVLLGGCRALKFERKCSLLHAVIFKHEIIKEIWITVKELYYSLFFLILLVIMFLYFIHGLLIKFTRPNSRRPISSINILIFSHKKLYFLIFLYLHLQLGLVSTSFLP